MKAYTVYLGLTTRHGTDLREAVGGEAIVQNIVELLQMHDIDGATITPATGVWKGQTEDALVVYFQLDDEVDDPITDICEELADDLIQNEVAYHESPTLTFIKGPYTY